MKLSQARCILLAALAGAAIAAPAAAESFLDVGKQPPISILVNSSPWYAGLQSVVGLYEKQTGNKVTLNVTPYNGVLEKARNDVRGTESADDILNIDTGWTIEFYEGGFLKPLDEIEPGFALPKEVSTCGDFYFGMRRGAFASARAAADGDPAELQRSYSGLPQGPVRAGRLPEPKTYADVAAACEKLQSQPKLYGFVTRGERGNGIAYDWWPYMLSYGAKLVADPAKGDYTVTINSPEGKAALDQYIALMKKCAPPNVGSIGQADVIQLMGVGKAAMIQVVTAAWANLQDPNKSTVAGKVNAAVLPGLPGKTPGVAIGNWHFSVPKNIPADRQKADLAFFKWFLTKEAQKAYAEAGGIPVRTDVLAELSAQPKFAWMKAYSAGLQIGQQINGYAEGAAVEAVMGLRLNEALLGQKSSAQALNTAAREINEIFTRSGRKTGMLAPLPE